MEVVQYGAIYAALFGTFMTTENRDDYNQIYGMAYWCIANILAMIYFFSIGCYGFFVLNLIYLVMSVRGIYKRLNH